MKRRLGVTAEPTSTRKRTQGIIAPWCVAILPESRRFLETPHTTLRPDRVSTNRRGHRVGLGTLALTTTLLALGFVHETLAQTASNPNVNEPEVLTRGPVHEAWAEPISFDAEPGPVAPRIPPEPVEEMPPDQRPEGDSVEWIAGYWHWDDERDEFLWVSGIWRNIPPGRQWVPGYWYEFEDGSAQWVSGFWTALDDGGQGFDVAQANAGSQAIRYLPQPPPSLEAGPNIPAPGEDHFWAPGCWYWTDDRYVWRPGTWVRTTPRWVWVPPCYHATPGGYVFTDGYWDYPLATRGVLFAPVRFAHIRAVEVVRPVFRFTPSVVIVSSGLMEHLFCRPSFGHYYFGDYYEPAFIDRGFTWWARFGVGSGGFDPLFNFYWSNVRTFDPGWNAHLNFVFDTRRNDPFFRPAPTFNQQLAIVENRINSPTIVNRNVTIVNRPIINRFINSTVVNARADAAEGGNAEVVVNVAESNRQALALGRPLADLAARPGPTATRFVNLERERRDLVVQRARELRAFRERRLDAERNAAVELRAQRLDNADRAGERRLEAIQGRQDLVQGRQGMVTADREARHAQADARAQALRTRRAEVNAPKAPREVRLPGSPIAARPRPVVNRVNPGNTSPRPNPVAAIGANPARRPSQAQGSVPPQTLPPALASQPRPTETRPNPASQPQTNPNPRPRPRIAPSTTTPPRVNPNGDPARIAPRTGDRPTPPRPNIPDALNPNRPTTRPIAPRINPGAPSTPPPATTRTPHPNPASRPTLPPSLNRPGTRQPGGAIPPGQSNPTRPTVNPPSLGPRPSFNPGQGRPGPPPNLNPNRPNTPPPPRNRDRDRDRPNNRDRVGLNMSPDPNTVLVVNRNPTAPRIRAQSGDLISSMAAQIAQDRNRLSRETVPRGPRVASRVVRTLPRNSLNADPKLLSLQNNEATANGTPLGSPFVPAMPWASGAVLPPATVRPAEIPRASTIDPYAPVRLPPNLGLDRPGSVGYSDPSPL